MGRHGILAMKHCTSLMAPSGWARANRVAVRNENSTQRRKDAKTQRAKARAGPEELWRCAAGFGVCSTNGGLIAEPVQARGAVFRAEVVRLFRSHDSPRAAHGGLSLARVTSLEPRSQTGPARRAGPRG